MQKRGKLFGVFLKEGRFVAKYDLREQRRAQRLFGSGQERFQGKDIGRGWPGESVRRICRRRGARSKKTEVRGRRSQNLVSVAISPQKMARAVPNHFSMEDSRRGKLGGLSDNGRLKK